MSYLNFGHLPTGSLRQDIRLKLFGHPNLLKRLQAKDIMKALDIHSVQLVLDIGCGAGYFTAEMAKLASRVFGVDTIPSVENIRIPFSLAWKLQYLQADATKLPFPNEYFDRVLTSEVLPMVSDPGDIIREAWRVLKPGGLLVVVNGAGHPSIEQSYRNRPFLFRWLERKYPGRIPASYTEYCSILQSSFGTAQRQFLQEGDLVHFLRINGFSSLIIRNSPGHLFGLYFSWFQFLRYLKGKNVLSQKGFIWKFYFFSLVRLFEKRDFEGGLICVAKK